MALLTTDFTTYNVLGQGNITASSSTSYSTTRNATSGSTNPGGTLSIESRDTGSTPRWYTARGFLNFNTTTLPTSASIISAVLRLNGIAWSDGDSISIHVVQTSQESASSMTDNDFNNLTFVSGGSIAVSSIAIGSYNEITLNATGLTYLVKGGVTKIGLITSIDLNNGTPTGGAPQDWASFTGGNGANLPVLRITYRTQGGNRGYIF